MMLQICDLDQHSTLSCKPNLLVMILAFAFAIVLDLLHFILVLHLTVDMYFIFRKFADQVFKTKQPVGLYFIFTLF